MILLENLSLFVRFSQFFSFLPYYMEWHPQSQSKRFKQISFSWKKPITWWFIFVVLFQFVFVVCRSLQLCRSNHNESEFPLIFSLFYPVEILFLVIATATYRFAIIFKVPHLRRAQNSLRKAQQLMSNVPPEDIELDGQAVKKRSVFGLIWVFIGVSLILKHNQKVKNHGLMNVYIPLLGFVDCGCVISTKLRLWPKTRDINSCGWPIYLVLFVLIYYVFQFFHGPELLHRRSLHSSDPMLYENTG